MRQFIIIILIFFINISVYPQKQSDKTQDKNIEKKSGITESEKKDAEGKSENKKTINEPQKGSEKSGKISDGFGNISWGMYVSEVKDKINGILSYTDNKKIIISKDSELEYYYGFFYKEPETVDTATKKDDSKTTTEHKTDTQTNTRDEGRLLYISVSFPYLDKEIVYEKLKGKFGPHTNENIKDNQGAIAWNLEKTMVIMWVDKYEKKPFCRKIIYISKDLSKELNEYTNSIFSKEIEVFKKKMNP